MTLRAYVASKGVHAASWGIGVCLKPATRSMLDTKVKRKLSRTLFSYYNKLLIVRSAEIDADRLLRSTS